MKRNEYAELTEMAGVAEAETQAAYAWGALDYDDPDEFPTQRLTPRRITSLGIAASLVTIAVAGAAALSVFHNTNQPVTQASSPPVIETVARPVPSPTVTVTQAPAIPRAGFFGEWGMHGMSVTLAPDGSAHYMAWLGVPLGVRQDTCTGESRP